MSLYKSLLSLFLIAGTLSGCLKDGKITISSTENAVVATSTSSNGNSIQVGPFRRLSQTSGASATSNDQIQNFPQPIKIGNWLYFIAWDNSFVTRWYKTDGVTVAQLSTNSTKASNAAVDSYTYPANQLAAGTTKIIFTATNSTFNSRIYVIDTSSSDAITELDSGDPYTSYQTGTWWAAINGSLWFEGYNGSDSRLFRINLSNNTTTMLADTNMGSDDYCQGYVGSGGNLYYISKVTTSSYQYFKYDGAATTALQTTTNPSDNAAPIMGWSIGGNLYFKAFDGLGSGFGTLQFYRYAGSLANPGISTSDTVVGVLGSKLIYYDIAALKSYDDTGNTIVTLADTYAGNNDWPSNATILGSDVFFRSSNNTGLTKSYRYNGVTTAQLSSTSPIASDGSAPFYSGNDGKIYYMSQNASAYSKMYSYDPGTTNVAQVLDLNPGSNDVIDMATFRGGTSKLLFSAQNLSGYYKYYLVDGASASQITNVNVGASDYADSSFMLGNVPIFSFYISVPGYTALFVY